MSLNNSRRDFLANLAMVASLVPGFGLAAAYAIRFLVPPSERRTEQVLLGRLGDLKVGASRTLENVHGNDLIAIRLGEREIKVFSAICTHLGCRVQWDPVAGNFLCPCHMGRFDTTGKVIAGPPPRPLPSFPVLIEGDNVFAVVRIKGA